MPFTVDEATSYGLFHGMPWAIDLANNQWLNTLLMQAGQSLFGQSEWALRLPNVLAFGVYGSASLWLVHRLRSSAARLVCFALLLGDPFMLEFFGLARGYGLSVAFSSAALMVLLLWRLDGSGSRAVTRFGLIGLLSAVAFYANFSSLNVVIALLAGAVLDTGIRSRKDTLNMRRRHWAGMVAVAVAIGAGFLPGLLRVLYLNAQHQLFYGGVRGFVPDTLGSLVMTWGYVYRYVRYAPVPGWALAGAWIVAGLGLTALVYVLVRSARERRWSSMQLVAFLVAISVIAMLAEHIALGEVWPIDRVALVYIPLFAVLLGLVVDDLSARVVASRYHGLLAAIGACVVFLAMGNVVRAANLTHALTWPKDASSRAAIDRIMALEERVGQPRTPWNLVVVWPRDEALTYYKTRFGLNWLKIDVLLPSRFPIRFPSDGFIDEVPAGYPVKLPAGTRLLARLAPYGTELWLHPPSGADPAHSP